MKVLVINCGSSSIKYQLIHTEDKETLCKGLVERIGAVTSIIRQEWKGEKPIKKSLALDNHTIALKTVMELLVDADNDYLSSLNEIEAVGHRVVHGGETFKDSVLIDEDVEEAIQEAFDIAPLHNPPNLQGIRAAKEQLPDVPHVAVFDTAFHQTLPSKAYLYGIPNRLYRRYKIRRYGFHGTSHYYVSRKYYKLADVKKKGSKIITCHLGNGASITAIKDGESIDTSMGFTPLEGLVMGTRSGDIDPSILFYLIEKEELSLANVHALLNKHSGLLGLSGYAADMRDLIEEAEDGDKRSQEAIDVFCYRAKKYIGSYIASMNGVDAIIFTGGIG
ncbi:MAG: acetate kinase, partial [Balneola sp.]